LPDFQIDYRESDVEAVTEAEEKKEKDKATYKTNQSAIRFKIGLFRRPEPIIGTLFLPIMILTMMQSLVFFSNGSQNEKMANCATILLAILSYQQVFRLSIPVVPETTLGDEHIYSSLIVTVITAIDAFLEGNNDVNPSGIGRLLIFAGLFLYPLYVYKKTIQLYSIYKRDLPERSKEPENLKKNGETLNFNEWEPIKKLAEKIEK